MIAEESQLNSPLVLPSANRVNVTALFSNEWTISVFLGFLCALPTALLWHRMSYLTGDSYQYLRAALTFSQGQGLRDMSGNAFTVMSPVYPLLTGVVRRLIPTAEIETLARLVSFTGATVAVLAFYSLLRARNSIWISFTAAALFALLPLRVWSGSWVLSEGLYVGLLMLAFATLFRPTKGNPVSFAVGGLLLGFAYLTRPEAILYVVIISALALVKFPNEKRKALLLLGGFLLVVLPYSVWVQGTTGKSSSGRLSILLSQSQALYEGKASNVLVFNRANSDGTSMQQLGSEMTVIAIARRYAFFAREEIGRLSHLIGPRLLVLAIFAVGGLLFMSRNIARKFRQLEFADAWPFVLASWLLFLPFLHVEDRYLLQATPAFLFWIVLAVAGITNFIAGKSSQRPKLITALVPLAFAAVFFLSYAYRLSTQLPERDSSTLARNTARWFHSQNFSPAPIVSQAPDLAFFSNSKHVWMADGKPADVVLYAQRNGARYLYVSSQDVPTQLNDLLLRNRAEIPQSLNFLHEETDGPTRARLFEIDSNEHAISSNLHL